MKTILACLVFLAISVPLSNAACFVQPLDQNIPDGEIKAEDWKKFSKKRCRDFEGKLHAFGSKWRTPDCLDCSCSKGGISCCSAFGTPVNYDENKCIKIFNKKTCTYKVVEKNDHSKECVVTEWVG